MKLPTHLLLDISNKIKKNSRTYFFFSKLQSIRSGYTYMYKDRRFSETFWIPHLSALEFPRSQYKVVTSYRHKIFSSYIWYSSKSRDFEQICHWHRNMHLQGLDSPDFYVVRSLLFLEKGVYFGQYWKAKKILSLPVIDTDSEYYWMGFRNKEYLKTKKILPAGLEDSDSYFMNSYPNSYFNIDFLQKERGSRSNWIFFNKYFLQKERISGPIRTYFNINFLRKERLYTKLKYSRCPQYDSVSGGIAAILSGFLGFLICEKFGLELLDSGDFYIAFMYAVFVFFSVRPFLKILSFENSVFNIFSLKILCKFLLDLIYLLFATLKYCTSFVFKILNTYITYVLSLIR